MIATLLLRAIFLYLLFIFFRAVWRSYKSIETFKKTVNAQSQASSKGNASGVYEAEYRVVSERE